MKTQARQWMGSRLMMKLYPPQDMTMYRYARALPVAQARDPVFSVCSQSSHSQCVLQPLTFPASDHMHSPAWQQLCVVHLTSLWEAAVFICRSARSDTSASLPDVSDLQKSLPMDAFRTVT